MKYLLFGVIASVAACGGGGGSNSGGGDDGGGGADTGGSGSGGSITWKVDGTSHSGSVVIHTTVMNGTVGIAAGDTSGGIGLAVLTSTAGTFPIGGSAPTGIEIDDTMQHAWKAQGAMGSGQIVISTFGAHEIIGTFEGTVVATGSATGTHDVTDGQFDLSF